MKNLLKISLIAFITLGMASCSSDDDNGNNTSTPDPNPDPQTNTIADFVVANDDYSSLEAALNRTNLTATLSGQGDFTVFAPNNSAFAAFLSANGFASLDDVPTDLLTNVLLNHVVSGSVLAADLTTGYINSLATETTSGETLSMYVNTSSGVVLNGISTVTTADIEADNGVIHAVNTVIALPTVVTFATADPTFATLVAALTRNDQPDYVSVLSTTAGTSPTPFTVFAPTNDAFADLVTELGIGGLEDIDTATLTAALNTHVIAGANVRAENLTNGTVGTLGADLIIDAENATLTDPNDRVSNIIVVNVQASNGVVHAIDKVLLPQL